MKERKINMAAISWWIISFIALFIYLKSCAIAGGLLSSFVITLMDFACLACSAYLIRQYLIPKYLYEKKLFSFALFLALLVIVFANLVIVLQWNWYRASGLVEENIYMQLLGDFFFQWFDCYMVIFIGCLCIIAFKLLKDQWLAQTRYAELQKEKAQTELSFLKAQINPHFLFNSINSIFAHIDKNNRPAREIVLKFSDMLRYQLYECNSELISFHKEFSYLENYIALQKLRKDENLQLIFESTGDMANFEIAPLLLIPFVENAFKYLSSHDNKENMLRVTLVRTPGCFSFNCLNTKDSLMSRNLLPEQGIGIKNVQRRLELLYPGKHLLEIKNNNATFEVDLKINIT